MTYRQAVNWATDIKEYTQVRRMPPWKISAGMPFHNERRLSDRELAVLAAWADNGTPEGDPKDAPPPVKFAEGWKLGTPDLVLTVPEEFQVGPTGNDVFRCFVLPTNLTEDKYVAAVEVRPGNSRIVHHALLFHRQRRAGPQAGKASSGRTADDDPARRHRAGQGARLLQRHGRRFHADQQRWAVGRRASCPRTLPDGTGILLPKGSRRGHAGSLSPQRPAGEGQDLRSACISQRKRWNGPSRAAFDGRAVLHHPGRQ